MKNISGKLIVVEGIDGSGKATQTQMLVEYLKDQNISAEQMDFPRYDTNMLGSLIGECLAGEHGDYAHLDPKIGSLLYAADRFESKKQIQEWLDAGVTVVTDRYVGSNQIHQGGKISDIEQRNVFMDWVDSLEYGVFGLPQPDFTVYLDMDLVVAEKLLEEARSTKDYLGGAQDAHESDTLHLHNARASAQYAIEKNAWHVVRCVLDGVLQSKEQIHTDIVHALPNFNTKNS